MSLLPVLFRLPLVLMPLHIVFLELVIDPACSTAFESEREHSNIMNRPPRNPAARLFDRKNSGFVRPNLSQAFTRTIRGQTLHIWLTHTCESAVHPIVIPPLQTSRGPHFFPEAHDSSQSTLQSRYALLAHVAQYLIQKETLDRAAVGDLIR